MRLYLELSFLVNFPCTFYSKHTEIKINGLCEIKGFQQKFINERMWSCLAYKGSMGKIRIPKQSVK